MRAFCFWLWVAFWIVGLAGIITNGDVKWFVLMWFSLFGLQYWGDKLGRGANMRLLLLFLLLLAGCQKTFTWGEHEKALAREANYAWVCGFRDGQSAAWAQLSGDTIKEDSLYLLFYKTAESYVKGEPIDSIYVFAPDYNRAVLGR